MKRSKKYQGIYKVLKDAKNTESFLQIICSNNPYKFDQSIEVKISIYRKTKNYTPYRFGITFPNPFGKSVRILVLAEPYEANLALQNGADYAGLDDMIDKIANENWTDFDFVIATPQVMPKIAKLGKILSSKGLMPNPKDGTITSDIITAIKEFKNGRRNFKEDKTGVINTVVGKISQGPDLVLANIKKLSQVVQDLSSNISNEIKTIYIKSSMSPSFELSKSEFLSLGKS